VQFWEFLAAKFLNSGAIFGCRKVFNNAIFKTKLKLKLQSAF
jgi:hypothetical protein